MPITMPPVMISSHVVSEMSMSAQIPAGKGHSSAGVTQLYTQSSSARPRSSSDLKIFTPMHHLQNTSVLVKIFQSNK